MRTLCIYTLLSLSFIWSSCSDDDNPQMVIVDPTVPQGTFAVDRNGNFIEQNGTGSAGLAELGTDSDGVQFLRFGNDFTTNLNTGTVTVYFSTSMDFVADPANGNPDLRIVGPVQSAGENFFRLTPSVAGQFSHVILWCGSANIPFGYAELN